MKKLKTILSIPFLNDFLIDLNLMDNYSLAPKVYTEYFEKKIGDNILGNNILYFTREPNHHEYLNQIFRKMTAYTGYDALSYIRYHLERFPNRIHFLEFLICELTVRLNNLKPYVFFMKKYRANQKNIYTRCLEFAKEELENIKGENKSKGNATFFKNDIDLIVNNPINNNEEDKKKVENLPKMFFDKLEIQISPLMDKMQDQFIQANIQINTEEALKFFIVSMIILKNKNTKSGTPLFGNFAEIDIAKILVLNFEHYKSKKVQVGTVAKYVSEVRDNYYKNNNKEKQDKDIDIILDM